MDGSAGTGSNGLLRRYTVRNAILDSPRAQPNRVQGTERTVVRPNRRCQILAHGNQLAATVQKVEQPVLVLGRQARRIGCGAVGQEVVTGIPQHVPVAGQERRLRNRRGLSNCIVHIDDGVGQAQLLKRRRVVPAIVGGVQSDSLASLSMSSTSASAGAGTTRAQAGMWASCTVPSRIT